LQHLVTVYLPKLEKITLRRLFDAIDVEKDGEIEMNEFIKVMKQKFEIEVVEEDFERVLKEVDLNFDGKIQFTEFLMAGCNKR
jgi:Ca2+-binding EF-hand superfamily protein